jgi:hypothetical protein
LIFQRESSNNLLTGKHVVEVNLIHLNLSEKRGSNAFRHDVECNWS